LTFNATEALADGLSSIVQFSIRPQEVGAALIEFSNQTHLQVVSVGAEVRGLKSPGVNGSLSTADALQKLLLCTGLSFELINAQTVRIFPSRPAQATQGTSGETTSVESVSPPAGSSEPLKLEEVLVTAEKREERLQDVPVPVTVVSAGTLLESNQVQLQDYYTTIPGLSLQERYQSTVNLTIRGIGTGAFLNPTVGVLVDDVPFGSSTAGGAGLVIPDIDPSNLDRVEVLRGPQGTLYGANSMGGLLKYVTKDPSTEGFSGRVEAGTDSVHNGAEPGFLMRASANLPLGDSLAVRVSGFRRQDAGYVDNPLLNLKGVNEAQADGASFSGLWRPTTRFSLKLSALYQQIKANGQPEVVKGAGLADLQQNYVPGGGSSARTVQAYSATLNADLGGIKLTSVTGYNINRHENSLDFSFAFGGDTQNLFQVSGAPLVTVTEVKKLTQEVRFLGQFGDRFDWLAGGFYTKERTPTYLSEVLGENPVTGAILGTGFLNNSPSSYQEYAGFADLTYHLTDAADVQFGARQTHYSFPYGPQVSTGPIITGTYAPESVPVRTAAGNAFTYLVTPSYKLSHDMMIYARLASGYRPGGPNDALLGAPSQYNPDKTQNYELGFKGDFIGHTLSIDASLYYIDWSHIQVGLVTPSFGAYTANGNGAKSEGIELSVAARPAAGLAVTAWVAYDHAVLTQAFPGNSSLTTAAGDRLPFSPQFSANLSLEQSFPLSTRVSGFAGGDARYVGNRIGEFQPTVQREIFPAYASLDLRAGVKYESWMANLYVNNVTDRRGLTNGGLGYFPPNAFIYIQPRTYGLNVSTTLGSH